MKSKTFIFGCLFLLVYFSIYAQEQGQKEKNNNLKVTLLSLMSGSAKLTYERQTFTQQSFEITGGLIGAGFDLLKHNQSKGALCRLAYKFIFPGKKNLSMQGWYIKPEFAFSAYTYNHLTDLAQIERLAVRRLAVMSVGGYELVKKWFVFDIFAGMGIGLGDANYSNYHHGYIGLNPESALAFTAGFKLGVAF